MMSVLVEGFADGGPFANIVLLTGVSALGLGVARLFVKKVDFSPATTGALLLTVAFGALGAAMGFIDGFQAAAVAPPEMKVQFFCAVSSLALYPLLLAVALVIVQVALGAVAGFVEGLRARETSANEPVGGLGA